MGGIFREDGKLSMAGQLGGEGRWMVDSRVKRGFDRGWLMMNFRAFGILACVLTAVLTVSAQASWRSSMQRWEGDYRGTWSAVRDGQSEGGKCTFGVTIRKHGKWSEADFDFSGGDSRYGGIYFSSWGEFQIGAPLFDRNPRIIGSIYQYLGEGTHSRRGSGVIEFSGLEIYTPQPYWSSNYEETKTPTGRVITGRYKLRKRGKFRVVTFTYAISTPGQPAPDFQLSFTAKSKAQ
jgi:hypothetical protein